MIDAPYDVFISHGWHDRWIAAQMARSIKDVGASPFIDIFDIKKGDRIEERVREGLTQCRELIVLLLPGQSVERGCGPKLARLGFPTSG